MEPKRGPFAVVLSFHRDFGGELGAGALLRRAWSGQCLPQARDGALTLPTERQVLKFEVPEPRLARWCGEIPVGWKGGRCQAETWSAPALDVAPGCCPAFIPLVIPWLPQCLLTSARDSAGLCEYRSKDSDARHGHPWFLLQCLPWNTDFTLPPSASERWSIIQVTPEKSISLNPLNQPCRKGANSLRITRWGSGGCRPGAIRPSVKA